MFGCSPLVSGQQHRPYADMLKFLYRLAGIMPQLIHDLESQNGLFAVPGQYRTGSF